jgi:hypothetical protein
MAENPFDEPQTTNSPRNEAPPAAPSGRPSWHRRRWVGFITVMAVFLAGFLPMWFKAMRNADERDTAQREIKLLNLESLAAAAAIDARRGEYESARQSASRFFTAMRAELDGGSQSALAQVQQEALKALLARRDDLITLLARNDPASAERLTEVYLTCRKSLRTEASFDGSTAHLSKP